MTIHYETTWEPNGIYCRCTGSACGMDVYRYLNDVAANPGFETFRYRITDARGVSHVRITPDELRWAADARELHARRNPRMLEVLVSGGAPIRELWRGLVAASRNPQRFAEFGSLAEARAWIDRELPVTPP